MFTLSIVLEERADHGELISYNKHEITDPAEAAQLVAGYRVCAAVDDDWREAGGRAREFFLRRWVQECGETVET